MGLPVTPERTLKLETDQLLLCKALEIAVSVVINPQTSVKVTVFIHHECCSTNKLV